MARRTKQDALVTRHSLLDAAELLFQAQGVSRTSLNDIAHKAATSRGAIYWHFKDKADLFNAMMDRVTLPLEQAFQNMDNDADHNSQSTPLDNLRRAMRDALYKIATDPRTRRVFEVATHKVEYVDELQAVRLRHLKVRNEFLAHVTQGLSRAAVGQNMTLAISPAIAAQGLHAMVDGLIQSWLLDSDGFDLTTTSEQLIGIYLSGLGFHVTS